MEKEEAKLAVKSNDIAQKHNHDMEKKEFDRQVNLEQLALQKRAGDTNLGVFNP